MQGALDGVAGDTPNSQLFERANLNEASGRLLEELLERQRAQVSRLGQLSRIMGTIGTSEAAMDAKLDAKQPDTQKADAGV